MSSNQHIEKHGFECHWRAVELPYVEKQSNAVILRPWQDNVFTEYMENSPLHLSINAPTGGGKSKAICYISIEKLRSNPLQKVIIAVPQKNIGAGFCELIDFNYHDGKLATWMVSPSNNLCTEKVSDTGKVNLLLNFIESPTKARMQDRVLVCTHTTLSMAFSRIAQKDKLANIDMWIDEAHHIQSSSEISNSLGEIVNYFLKNGKEKSLSLNMTSATLFRGDKLPIVDSKFNELIYTYKLPYDKHFEENCQYLKSFKYDFVMDEGGWIGAIEKLFQNEIKKTIIFIPHPNTAISTGHKFNEVRKIIEAIAGCEVPIAEDDSEIVLTVMRDGKEVRIIDLVDDRNDNLRSQRDEYIRNHPDQVDVIININKFAEGADWPQANRAIIVGHRGSLTQMIQMIGRLFRDHIDKDGNPVEVYQVFSWVDTADLDRVETKNMINDYMKGVYSNLIMESIINPPIINLKPKKEKPCKDVESKDTPITVMDLIASAMSEEEYNDFIETAIEKLIDFRVDNPNIESCDLRDAYKCKLVSEFKSDDTCCFGEDDYEEVAGFVVEILSRRTRNNLKISSGMNVSDIDFDAVNEYDPLDFVVGYTNDVCGIKTLKAYREVFENSAYFKKLLLLEIAKNGGEKPSCKHYILGGQLFEYTNTNRRSYDSEFDKEIRESRPDWFVGQSDIAYEKKQRLLSMAENGEERPVRRKHELAVVFHQYTNVNTICYDSEFDKEIRELRPDWFVNSVEEKKQILLSMAENGEDRPVRRKHALGRSLEHYTNKNDSMYDSEFDRVIRSLSHEWFIYAGDKKKKILEMARRGDSKPKVGDDIYSSFNSYICRFAQCYDAEFDKEIRALRPDWLKK